MTNITRYALLGALILGTAGSSLAAQEGPAFDVGLKVHAGSSFGDLQEDTKTKKMVGIGATFSYRLGQRSALVGELAYLKFPANDYRNPLPAGATTTSADLRKDNLSGFSLRGGYRAPLMETGFNWQAGLTVDSLKSRQEVSGQITVGSVTTGLALTPETRKVNVGAFAGIHRPLSEGLSVELNLFTLGYEKVNADTSPLSTGQPIQITSTGRRGFAIELAVGLSF